MSKVYDSWEKLVGAVLKREELRQLALSESFSSYNSAGFSSQFSFNSTLEDLPHGDSVVQPIKLEEIKKATKTFQPNMLLGEGGFGLVYKGWIDEGTLTASLRDSGTAVAVKKRKQDSLQGHQEWSKEIKYLSQLRHPNLVKLIGYCSEKDNLILVYEFMPRGSLENYLFARGHGSLSWERRVKVAIGVARGLSFLHNLRTPVMHLGCHCSNILLDGEFNGKLYDFGLARDCPTDDTTHKSTRFMNTYGYAAPEHVITGQLTTKCDVYGFGIVLIELLSGRRVSDTIMVGEMQNLVEWVKHSIENRALRVIMDTRLKEIYPLDIAYTVGKLALQCLSPVPEKRPTMAEVVFALEYL